jgi:hypothetical protein
MEQLFININKYLPLKVTFCEIEDYFISIGSIDWNFYSDSNWRILINNKIAYSDDNFDVQSIKELLFRNDIVSITPLTKANLDPVFEFKNSIKLEIFSKSNTEPWKISLPDIVYVP